MIKRICLLLLTAISLFVFVGCEGLVLNPEETLPGEQPELALEDDKLLGFLLVFIDKDGNEITCDEFESEDAIKFYYYFDNSSSATAVTSIATGSWIYSEFNGDIGNVSDGLEISVEATVRYTSALVGGSMILYKIYYSEENESFYLGGGVGYGLQDFGSGAASVNQKLTASRKNSDGTEETLSYTASFKINFEIIDDLTGVAVIEYGEDNQIIQSRELSKTYIDGNSYVTSENCAYAVVEKHYYVSAEYELNTVKYRGMTYTEREVYSRPYTDRAQSVALIYPNENGLTEHSFLTLEFAQ